MKYRQLSIPLFGLLTVGCWLLAADSRRVVTAAPGAGADLEQRLKKATVDGKYRMLLAQIKVEKDREEYGDFRDLGARDAVFTPYTTEDAGFSAGNCLEGVRRYGKGEGKVVQ